MDLERTKRDYMIQRILKVYPLWVDLYSFSYGRVYAIYLNLLKRGKFKNKKNPKEKGYYHQMSIFDIFSEEEIGGSNGR